MKRLIFNLTKKEIKIGDTIELHIEFMPNTFINQDVVLDESMIEHFINTGLLSYIEEDDFVDISTHIQNIADRMNYSPKKLVNHLNAISEIHPMSAFSLVLKEVAVDIDKKYTDHIKNSPEIYVFDSASGTIKKANPKAIKSFKHFAAFRTLEDAKLACHILRDVIKKLYSNG